MLNWREYFELNGKLSDKSQRTIGTFETYKNLESLCIMLIFVIFERPICVYDQGRHCETNRWQNKYESYNYHHAKIVSLLDNLIGEIQHLWQYISKRLDLLEKSHQERIGKLEIKFEASFIKINDRMESRFDEMIKTIYNIENMIDKQYDELKRMLDIGENLKKLEKFRNKT